MLTETGSRLGWRTGASRLKMRPQLEQLQSFDPAERAEAGEELVTLGLGKCAHALLDHVTNEFDDRVLAAIAQAVHVHPIEPEEPRRVQELRQWASSELERLALEENFLASDGPLLPTEPVRREPPPAAETVAPAPAETAAAPMASRSSVAAPAPVRPAAPVASAAPVEPLPVRVPGAGLPSVDDGPAPTPVQARPVAWTAAQPERPALPYIYWRAPLELTAEASPSTNGNGHGYAVNGNGHGAPPDATSWRAPEPSVRWPDESADERAGDTAVGRPLGDTVMPRPVEDEYRFETPVFEPEPLDEADRYEPVVFEPPTLDPPTFEPAAADLDRFETPVVEPIATATPVVPPVDLREPAPRWDEPTEELRLEPPAAPGSPDRPGDEYMTLAERLRARRS